MPPGPLYNWSAVAHSALVILDHALQYRAAQVTRIGSIPVSQRGAVARGGGVYENTQEEVKDVVEEIVPSTADEPLSTEPTHIQPSSLLHANEAWLRQLEITVTQPTSLSEMVSEQQFQGDMTVTSMLFEPSSSSTTIPGIAETRPPATELPMPAADVNLSSSDAPRLESSRHLQSSKAPSSL